MISLQKRKPGLDKGKRLLTLHDFTPPTILYAQLKVYKLPLKIKLRALLKARSPRVILSCFLFSPFLPCSSFRTNNWSAGALWDHLFARASKTHSKRCLRWGTFHYLRGQCKPGVTGFIGFLRKPIRSSLWSLLLAILSLMPSSRRNPYIQPGLDPSTICPEIFQS